MSHFRLPWAYAKKIPWRITGAITGILLLISRKSYPDFDLKCCRHFHFNDITKQFPKKQEGYDPLFKIKAFLDICQP